MDAFENPIVNLYIMAWLHIYDTFLRVLQMSAISLWHDGVLLAEKKNLS